MRALAISALSLSLVGLTGAASAQTAAPERSVGFYAGRYYDTEPAGFINGRAGFVDHYLVAATASTTLWRAQDWPLSLELDGMLGYQNGAVSMWEVAAAPAVRWSGFPWNHIVQTDLRLAPLGLSYTSQVSPLERGPEGKGSQWLNWLFIEVALSSPKDKSSEYFARLHHRCSVYDTMNNYGANGEDFFTLGFRRRF